MRTWSIEEEESLSEYKGQGMTVQDMMTAMSEKYGKQYSYWSITKKLGRLDKHTQHPVKNEPGYNQQVEIDATTGTHKSDKLLRMSDNQAKDVNYLLAAHGYDVNEWELLTAKNNIWNVYSKEDKVQTLYSSKITVRPKVNGLDFAELLKRLKTVSEVTVERKYISTDESYLNLPLFDMHFGPSTYEKYKDTQNSILVQLEKNYSEVLIIIGQDLLHTDDFRGRTSSGREIGKIDMIKAWEDAALFYEPIIKEALARSDVKIMYSKGNHDESMSWAFVQYLKGKYPQAQYDDSFKERKVHMLGLNFVGVNHGDKKKEVNLNENFSTEFPMEWSRATTREIFTGHLHHERVLDKGGAVIRRMPTGNEIDDYHDDHGYTTAHKRFQIFEYTRDAVKSIHYV